MNKPSGFSHNPKISLAIALLICATVLLQMGYNVLHQIKDVPFDSDITPLMMSTIRDALFNHEIFINAFIAYSLIILSYQTVKQFFYIEVGENLLVLTNCLNCLFTIQKT